ncbi:hypothetical protein B0H14DRAFT_3132316 [Mycena olivaceomarginata]|nr:hypothetical protein B0H14DRAFT_3132316 [Mycena olivaceomarginata]
MVAKGGTPKRPLNAFMLFARQRRSKIGGKVADSSKILAKEWKEMGMRKKKKFHIQAQLLKEAFRRDFPDFKYIRKMKPRSGRCRTIRGAYISTGRPRTDAHPP